LGQKRWSENSSCRSAQYRPPFDTRLRVHHPVDVSRGCRYPLAFHVVRTQAGRLNDIDQKLVAVLRVHTSMLAFHDRLDGLADAEDADGLVKEAGPLRTAVLEDIRRATSALSLPPFDPRRDPTILPTLHVIQSALTSELEAITTLATSGDWRAVHLRLANQVRPLESLTSALVEKVDHEAGEQQAQTALNIRRVQRLVSGLCR